MNARLEVTATPSTPPADIDLFLERETEPGEWEEVTSGTSADTRKELLTAGRLQPGNYRLVVHNWAGAPQEVHLELIFFNAAGEPGEGSSGQGSAGTAVVVTNHSFGGLPQP